MTTAARFVFNISKPIHKYVGLVCLAYFMLMGISGVFLNHPSLIRHFSVPLSWAPPSYHYANWNRMALREVVFSEKSPDTLYVGGKAGVWESTNGGESFSLLENGFPASPYEMDVRCLLLTESGAPPHLYAGTRSGLYRYDFNPGRWQKINDGTETGMEIVDLVQTRSRILVFSPSACYHLALPGGEPALHPMPLTSRDAPNPRAPLFRFLLKLHDGSALGLPGRLFVDIVGLVLVFLSVSAVYIWYIPWSKKRFRKRIGKRRASPRFFRFFYRYHLKLGIWGALFLGGVALTGMFVRPPLLIPIIHFSVPSVLLNGSRPAETWQPRISRALYSPEEDTVLLATRDGFFRGPADFSQPFEPAIVDVPVSGMGVNVLEHLSGHRLLVGSFSGLYIWDHNRSLATDVKNRPVPRRRRRGPGADMAAGAAVKNGTLLYWADYRHGLRPADPGGPAMAMPDRIAENSRMSLWHFLFEVHNGRIFRDWLGACTWLIVPVGGLVLLVNVLSGSYDWLYRR